jgi:hypothetical protein
MRRSSLFFIYLGIQAVLLTAAFTHAAYLRNWRAPDIAETRAMVQRLELTDLCLFTEARYTRHPSQADMHAPFQDHPMSLEHFPSGSLLGPQQGRRGP